MFISGVLDRGQGHVTICPVLRNGANQRNAIQNFVEAGTASLRKSNEVLATIVELP